MTVSAGEIMNRLFAAAIVATLLGGCYVDGEYVSGDTGVGISVTSAPPPLRYEVPVDCGGNVWAPGAWDWGSGGWYWRSGQCLSYQSGYIYVRPYYAGGVYYR